MPKPVQILLRLSFDVDHGLARRFSLVDRRVCANSKLIEENKSRRDLERRRLGWIARELIQEWQRKWLGGSAIAAVGKGAGGGRDGRDLCEMSCSEGGDERSRQRRGGEVCARGPLAQDWRMDGVHRC